jgi:hypothetical protein
MDKKVIVTLFVTFLLFGFVNFAFINFFGIPFSPVLITGHAVNDTGIVQIFIEETYRIDIYSPENISYNFSKGDLYIIGLNVSADFVVDEWRYSLYDLKHSVFAEQDVVFVPNSSISAVRWGNLLTVFAHEQDGSWYNKSVIFYVEVPNSAPLLGNITEPILVCEGDSLDYRINATDFDEDDLVGDISPKNPFYLSHEGRILDVSFFDIISGVLSKGHVGSNIESISVEDPFGLLDMRSVGIDVIEINNMPALQGLGAQTVWLTGEDSTFNHTMYVYDVEDGETSNGKFKFNLTWGGNENLFGIGINSGAMNYRPVVGQENRTYSLRVCVEDNALGFIHQNISFCSPDVGGALSSCDDFTLTVTNENRAPRILSHSPISSVLEILGEEAVEYSVVVYDPDGTIPDIDWYVDGRIVEHNENISNDTFSYAFACGLDGPHRISIITSDGLLNDSWTWNIDLEEVICSSSGGGGGGGGGDFCVEEWVCDDWDVCQNVKRSFESKVLSIEDYSVARDTCSQNKEEDERFCGFQIRECRDLSECGRIFPIIPKPGERKFCYFTENPSCFDKVTNCHDGGCELLADCGGPCPPCPTCSDGKQNQGESGIDCGGPCPFLCEPEVPFAFLSSILIVISILLVFIIIWILWRLFLLWKRRDEEEEGRPHVVESNF